MKGFYVAPSLLGRLYLRPMEYMSELKSLVKATGFKKVPVELRDLIKEQAWEVVNLRSKTFF